MAMNDSEGARFFRPWRLAAAEAEEPEEPIEEEEEEEEQPREDGRVKDEAFGCCASSDTDSMRSSSVNSEDADDSLHHQHHYLHRHHHESHRSPALYPEGAAAAPAHWAQTVPGWPPVPYGSWMPSNLLGMQEAVNRLHAVAAAEKQSKKLRPKKYQCGFCNVAFSNNGQLKGHERIHTGERPYKCDFEHCGKTFTRNEELTRHKRIHTGERPHACPICRKSFGRKDHLKKHTKTHENRQVCQLAAASQFVGFHYPGLAGPAAFGLPALPYF